MYKKKVAKKPKAKTVSWIWKDTTKPIIKSG